MRPRRCLHRAWLHRRRNSARAFTVAAAAARDPSTIDGGCVCAHAPGYCPSRRTEERVGDGAADTVSPLRRSETDILAERKRPQCTELRGTVADGSTVTCLVTSSCLHHYGTDDDVVGVTARCCCITRSNRHTSSDEESESTDHQTSLPLSNAVPNAAHIAVTVTEFDSHALRMDDEDADSSHGADAGLLRPRTVHDHDSEDGDDEHSDMRTSSRQSGPPVRPQHETTDDDEHEPDRQLSDAFTQADRAQQQTQLWGQLRHHNNRTWMAEIVSETSLRLCRRRP